MASLFQCLKYFPILDCLLSYLSATDSAIILGVTGLLYDPDNNMYTRYVDIYRDIPRYADWIRTMVSKGHTVLLVGKDLGEIERSYKYPLSYWGTYTRSQPRSLWLVALTTKMFKDELGKAESQSAMDESGDVFEIPRFSEPYLRYWHLGGACSNILCYPSSLSVSYNVPLPVLWPDCAYDMMKNRSWHTLSRDSDSGIDLIYLPNYCAEEMLFDEATRASEPYFSAIFGSEEPFYEPIAVPYMNMADGEVRISITDPYMDDLIDLPADIQWAGEEWSEHSDMDRFVFVFYRRHSYIRSMEYNRRCRFMAIEFTGLDPDLRGKFT